jgi:hypothetical protein
MKSIKKALIFGVLSWLIPFVASFFFFSPKGGLLIDQLLFKNIMVVVGSWFAAFLIIKYFKTVDKNFVKEGALLGLLWLAINLILDILILVPMGKMTMGNYFTQIGLEYLMIPAMTILVGKVLANKNK